MKTYPYNPLTFCGSKFAARYGLDAIRGDFWADGTLLHVPDGLPDDPPIFDPLDPPEIGIRSTGVVLVDQTSSLGCFVRSVLFVAIDELNLHAQKINSILTAVDDATSLADLKARIALIADYPLRTPTQARNAIKSKIDTGGAD